MAKWRCRRGWPVALVVAVLGGHSTALAPTDARAASITWERQGGAFEACLENGLEKWLQAQAALVVDDDPAAARLDDAAVARWTIDLLAECRARTGSANPKSEDRFVSHMARWRNHIYDLASSIRQRGASD